MDACLSRRCAVGHYEGPSRISGMSAFGPKRTLEKSPSKPWLVFAICCRETPAALQGAAEDQSREGHGDEAGKIGVLAPKDWTRIAGATRVQLKSQRAHGSMLE